MGAGHSKVICRVGHNGLKPSWHASPVRCGDDIILEIFQKQLHHQLFVSCISNIVAITLGLPPESNHLWTFLFQPQNVHKTWAPGTVYSCAIMASGVHYDCGTKFDEVGTPINNYTRIPLSRAHDRYLLLFASYSCFCISLLAFPESHKVT